MQEGLHQPLFQRSKLRHLSCVVSAPVGIITATCNIPQRIPVGALMVDMRQSLHLLDVFWA